MDHDLLSIQDYVDDKVLSDYYCLDLALQRDLIWQTKMLRTKLDEQSYFLHPVDLKDPEVRRLLSSVKEEMRGVLHMFPEN
jgi:S-adenosylmethionine decarboxylase